MRWPDPCGLSGLSGLSGLAGVAGMTGYGTVSIAVRRFEQRHRKCHVEQEWLKQVCQLLNVEM